jgi:hypothetical protein
MITDDFNSIAEADVYIICVADDAIRRVSSKLPLKPISGCIPQVAFR